TDSRGIIWDCCDGSFADFMRLVGAESIVAEVTGATADADAEEVYLAWIDGIAARWGKKNRG
ncbi:MAG: hypothetical protein HYZ07_00230, partial [Candidatus Harrisonbacteria bacterium]|nr:hypothetical protein [Candidatus Harrisonbacteria bacterium]